MAAATTIQLTQEQRQAVVTWQFSVGLSAGAGCGKTSVLTERFLAHLTPDATGRAPAKLSELVALTFTDKAAREMRDRIRRTCLDRQLTAPTDAEADYWLELVRKLDAARISTIHSFCAALLRRHAVECGLDPQFGVMEATAASALLSEVVDDTLRSALAERNPDAIDLAIDYDLGTLREMLLTIVQQRHQASIDEWLERSPEEIVARWSAVYQQQAVPALIWRLFQEPAVDEVLRLITSSPPNRGEMLRRCRLIEESLKRLQEIDGQTQPIKQDETTSALNAIHDNAKVAGSGVKQSFDDPELYDRYKETLSKFRDAIKKLRDKLTFDATRALPLAESGLRLLRVARPVIAAYEAQKRQLDVLDFDDLIARASALACDPANAKLVEHLGQGIKLLLVDEFQDTDPVQVEFIKALCGDALLGGKLFFVGDHKQSIYRFRGAAPDVFHELLQQMPDGGRLQLTENFRSQPAILEFVNALFAQLFGERYSLLQANRNQVAALPAIEFLWACQDETGDVAEPAKAADVAKSAESSEAAEPDGADEPSESGAAPPIKLSAAARRQEEALWLARRLRQLVDSGEPIVHQRDAQGHQSARGVQPGDICILLRAMSDVQYYEAALQKVGLEYYVVGGKAFYAQQEVYDVINLLGAVENLADEIALAGVLRSPMFSLSDEGLFWLGQSSGGLGAALLRRSLPKQLSPADHQAASRAAEVLRTLRRLKDRISITELLNKALALTGYDGLLLAEFLGQRKLANLRKLIDMARSFDESGLFGLAEFVAQLGDFVSTQSDEALAATAAEASDVVRIMTIHQSKGLEFPVVVLADMERENAGRGPLACLDPLLGPLIGQPLRAESEATGGLAIHKTLEAVAEDQERLRLLYVATTRAADYLILSSSVVDLDQPKQLWLRRLAQYFDLRTGATLQSLPQGTTPPQIRVTLTMPPAPPTVGSSRRGDLAAMADQAEQLIAQRQAAELPLVEPLGIDLAAQRVFSFSRLSGQLVFETTSAQSAGAEAAESRHDGATSQASESRELGTLVHEVLARWDLQDPRQLQRLLTLQASQTRLDQAAQDEAAQLLERFANSPRAAALRQARQWHRELEFLLSWPVATGKSADKPRGRATRKSSSKSTDQTTAAETVQLHGFIDCLYQDEAGRWHLLDYKTNQSLGRPWQSVAEGYELQMLLYAEAIERSLGTPPESLALHFLRSGEEVGWAWDSAARERLRQLLDLAIAHARGQVDLIQ